MILIVFVRDGNKKHMIVRDASCFCAIPKNAICIIYAVQNFTASGCEQAHFGQRHCHTPTRCGGHGHGPERHTFVIGGLQ